MRSDRVDEEQDVERDGGAGVAAVLEEGPVERLREMGRALSRDVPYRIIELYLKDAPAKMAELKRALSAGDTRAVEETAHSLKGSSANLGAIQFAGLCHELEHASRAESNGGVGLAELEAEYGRVEAAMRELLAEFG